MKVQVVEKSGLKLPGIPIGYRAYLARWVGEASPEWGEFGILQHIGRKWSIVAGGKVNYAAAGHQGNLSGPVTSRHSNELCCVVYKLDDGDREEADCSPEFIIDRELDQITFE